MGVLVIYCIVVRLPPFVYQTKLLDYYFKIIWHGVLPPPAALIVSVCLSLLLLLLDFSSCCCSIKTKTNTNPYMYRFWFWCTTQTQLRWSSGGEIGRQIPVRTRSVQKLSYCHKQILTFTFILIHPIPLNSSWFPPPKTKTKERKITIQPTGYWIYFQCSIPFTSEFWWLLFTTYLAVIYIVASILVKVLVQISFCTELICSWISEIHQDLLCLNCKCHNWCRSSCHYM